MTQGRPFDDSPEATDTYRLHNRCRSAFEKENEELINFLMSEKLRVRNEKMSLRDMSDAFKNRSERFRAVFDAAWVVMTDYLKSKKSKNTEQQRRFMSAPMLQLLQALELADGQWEGFAGCTHDPDPRAELHASPEHNKRASK